MTPETISITPEMIAILAIGVALAGLMLRGHHGLGRRMDGFDSQIVGLEQRFDRRIDGLEQRFNERIDGLEQRSNERMDGLEQRFNERMDGFDKRMDGFDKRMGGLEQRFDKRMDGFDERLRSVEIGQADLKGTILGKLELVERYIIARNLPAGEPALRSGVGAD